MHAVHAGANVLWANTTLHSAHALVTLRDKLPENVRFVGQNPLDTERVEDKAEINNWLNSGELEGHFPKSWLIKKAEREKLGDVELPAVVKPVRGRGSYGVSVVWNKEDLKSKADDLWKEGDLVLIEVSMRLCVSVSIVLTRMSRHIARTRKSQ